jgi:hypothetical protein
MNRAFNFFILVTALVISFSLAISYATPAAKPSPPHLQCSGKELKRRDCELSLKPYKTQLSSAKITWSDGTWTSIADAPLPGDKFDWEKVKIEKINNRYFIEYWIWDDGKGEAKIESLHWIVVELNERNALPQFDKIVRKREVRVTQPVSYSYDKMIPHALKKSKAGLQWSVGKEAGTI